MFHPDFGLWFNEGVRHILSAGALDHILFITALCIAYRVGEWKKTVLLVTAFTIGHSITLAAVALRYIQVNSAWVEFAIPLTIAFTAARQVFQPRTSAKADPVLYGTALIFGFIHGMAYGANPIGSLYTVREAVPLVLGFNLGIELAQLVVVAVVMLLSYLVVRLCKLPERKWQLLLSSCILIYAVYLCIKNNPF
ncbi:MAG: HupE/UreJ family protein [Dinghuibacter sp.]|nr:HupE/UreJ family protein [Dinghuibacter sp.]